MSNNNMQLSLEQFIAFNKYVLGKNIFITGPAGSGKTELIKTIYNHATNHSKNICVTALTGCAAIVLNCKANTLNSWAGIGKGTETAEFYIDKIRKNKFIKKSWKKTDILVIDEVSMLSLKLFNILDCIGRAIRGNTKPFGGIQLIFSGDFYQLPPVGNNLEPDTQKFCFESNEWNKTVDQSCQIELKKIFRQTDETYSLILNQIREGKIKRRYNELLLTYVGREMPTDMISEPTKLFPTKNKVEQINITRLSSLSSEEKIFDLKYITDLPITDKEKEPRFCFTKKEIQLELDLLAGKLLCEKIIKLKIGAQVMCIINIRSANGDILICNGSQGIITDFCKLTGCPKIKYNNGREMLMSYHTWTSDKIPTIGVSQVPLVLSWALTIHKSQGMTLEQAEIDVGNGIFECGQTYVALSRVKNLNGLYLTSFDAQRIKINSKVKEYYDLLRLYNETHETRINTNDVVENLDYNMTLTSPINDTINSFISPIVIGSELAEETYT